MIAQGGAPTSTFTAAKFSTHGRRTQVGLVAVGIFGGCGGRRKQSGWVR
jgi:hypothetical protein